MSFKIKVTSHSYLQQADLAYLVVCDGAPDGIYSLLPSLPTEDWRLGTSLATKLDFDGEWQK